MTPRLHLETDPAGLRVGNSINNSSTQRNHWKRFFIFFLISFIFGAHALLAEQNPKTPAEAQKIFDTYMSPYCAGRLLRDCPSGKATELKEQIKERLIKGESSQGVEQWLVTTFGETLLAAPKTEGFGIVAWIAPFFFLIAGGIFIAVWLRIKQRASKQEATQQEPLPPINQELRDTIRSMVEK